MVKISVIILTSGLSDRLLLLERLLRSISTQSLLPDEVIIATEANASVIKGMCSDSKLNTRCRVIETGYWNKCLTANKAVLGAGGDIVFLLEDDLYLTPNFIEEIMKTFSEFPEAGCVYTNCIWVFREGLRSRGGVPGFLAKLIGKLSIHESVLPKLRRRISDSIYEVGFFTMSVACKREALLRAGLYDASVREPILGEDFDLAFRVRKAGYKILQNVRAVSYHFTKQVTKGSIKYSRSPKTLMDVYLTEVYFMAKNRDLLGLHHVVAHTIYRILESVMWGIRSRSLLTITYGVAGVILGFLRGVLRDSMEGVRRL